MACTCCDTFGGGVCRGRRRACRDTAAGGDLPTEAGLECADADVDDDNDQLPFPLHDVRMDDVDEGALGCELWLSMRS